MKFSKRGTQVLSFIVVSLMVLASCVIITTNDYSDTSEATISGSYTTYDVDLAPGYTWTKTFEFPSDLSVTVTEQHDTQLDVTQTDKTFVVKANSTATAGNSYDLLITATTNTGGISQTVQALYRFTIVASLNASGSQANIVSGTAINMTPTATIGYSGATYTWAVTSGHTLPAGLTLNTSTGNVSGTPTTVGTNTLYLTVTASYTPTGSSQTATQTKDITVSFIVYNTIVGGSAETLNTYDGHSVSSTAITQTSGNGAITVTWTQKSTDTNTLADIGFTLNSSTGVITGSNGSGNEYTITLVGTSTEIPQQTTEKTITIKTEKTLTSNNGTALNGKVGTSITRTLTVSNALDDDYTISDNVTSKTSGVTATLGTGNVLTVSSNSAISSYSVEYTATSNATGQSKTFTITGQIVSVLVIENPTIYVIAYEGA